MSLWRNFQTKKYHGMVELRTGKIIAYENSNSTNRRFIETNANKPINVFPYTDEDIIVIKARKTLHN